MQLSIARFLAGLPWLRFTLMGAWVCLWACRMLPAADPSADELVEKMETWFAQCHTVEFQATIDERILGGFFGTEEREVRRESVRCLRDQDRWQILQRLDSWVRVANGAAIPGVAGGETEVVLNGQVRIAVQKDVSDSSVNYGVRAAFSESEPGIAAPADYLHETALLFGVLFHNAQRTLGEVLRASEMSLARDDSLALSEQPGVIAISGSGPYGRITAWIDPRDGALRRLVIEKQGADRTGGNLPVSTTQRSAPGGLYPAEPRTGLTVSVDEISLREEHGRRLMDGFRLVHETRYGRGAPVRSTIRVRYPEVSCPETISPDRFAVSSNIPDGTRVAALGRPGIDFEWRAGQISQISNEHAARKQAEVQFKRGYRSPWYLAGIVALVLVMLALVGYRVYAERTA